MMDFVLFSLAMGVIILGLFIYKKKIEKEAAAEEGATGGTTVKGNKAVPKVKGATAQNFLGFEKIVHGVLIRNKFSYRVAVEVLGISPLISDAEYDIIEENYKNFLRGLRFPVQIYIQCRRMDFTPEINEFRRNLDTAFSEGARNFGKASINYLVNRMKNKSNLSIRTFLIITYDTDTDKFGIGGNRANIFERAVRELQSRYEYVVNTLAACRLTVVPLDTKEYGELLYIAYNKERSNVMRFEDALQGGFNQLVVHKIERDSAASGDEGVA